MRRFIFYQITRNQIVGYYLKIAFSIELYMGMIALSFFGCFEAYYLFVLDLFIRSVVCIYFILLFVCLVYTGPYTIIYLFNLNSECGFEEYIYIFFK